MLGNLYLLKNFNNYFNRKIIYNANLSDYIDNYDYFLVQETNFNPGDGITASHIIGAAGNPFDKEWNPDYCLYVENNIVKSRWFVIEAERTRDCQYSIKLKRDSVADNLNLVKNAPCFIERGYVDNDSPFSVNDEGISVNQIKKGEYFLEDQTHAPWIVGFIQQRPDDETEGAIVGSYLPTDPSTLPILENDEIMKKYFVDSSGTILPSYDFSRIVSEHMALLLNAPGGGYASSTIRNDKAYLEEISSAKPGWISVNLNAIIYSEYHVESKIDMFLKYAQTDESFQTNLANALSCHSMLENIPAIKDKSMWYSTTDNCIYVVKKEVIFNGEWDNSTTCNDDVKRLLLKTSSDFSDFKDPFYFVKASKEIVQYSLVKSSVNNISAIISKTRNHLVDAPYDIIALPLGWLNLKVDSTTTKTIDPNISIAMARAIMINDAKVATYDFQVLPFCPIKGKIINGETIDLTQGTDKRDYTTIINNTTNEVIGTILYGTRCSDTFDITELQYRENGDFVSVSDIIKIYNRKMADITESYRLCSPNYQGLFDFKASRVIPLDKTSISSFNVDYTYRPYSSYIHVNPEFGFLFGQDFNDARGLIVGGDLSMTTQSDAWKEYLLNNKNYQNIFDRQIENMDTLRGIEREKENWQIAAGIFGGIGLGGLAGGNIGSITGQIGPKSLTALGGALAGGIFGGIAAGIDKDLNEKAYKENRDMAFKMFDLQLGNIKAVPRSITKTSTLSNNFKFFPVLEYYNCTDSEYLAVYNKLKYNGMSIGVIGNIKDYIGGSEGFIKGQLIRFNELAEDSHMASDIYSEINQGLYLGE